MSKTTVISDRWTVRSLSELCMIDAGIAFKSKDYEKDGIPLLRISNITEQGVQFSKNTVHLNPLLVDKFQKYLLKNGDIVIALSGATTGKSCIYKYSEDSILNQRVARLRFGDTDKELRDYVFYFLQFVKEQFLRNSKGGAQPNIRMNEITNLQIPSPPLEIQKKIVKNLNQQLTLLHNRFKSILLNIEKNKKELSKYLNLKNYVLDLSFQWANDDKKIADIEKNFHYHKIESWEWTPFEKLIQSMKNGLYKPSQFHGHGTPYLRMYNIFEGKINTNNLRKMELSDKEIKEYGLNEHDILFNRINTRELVGKSAVITKEFEGMVFEAMNIRIRVDSKIINPIFLNYFLQTKKMRRIMESECKKTVGMASIPQYQINRWQIPVPSIEDQSITVDNLERFFLTLDQIKIISNELLSHYFQIQQNYPKLIHLLLKQAFSESVS